MKTSARIIFNRRNIDTVHREAAVEVEVRHNGKRKYYPTGVRCLSANWYNRRNIYISGRHDAAILNRAIADKFNAIQQVIYDAAGKFSFALLEHQVNEDTFLDYMQQRAETRQDLREDTRRHHLSCIKVLRDANIIIDFADLTPERLRRLDDWLRQRGIAVTTISNYHRRIHAYMNMAIAEGLFDANDNPYLRYKVARGKSATRKYLDDEQLQRLITTPLPTDSLNTSRNLFLFQTYTGLAYADMQAFDWHNTVIRDGNRYILDQRIKTDEPFYIRILPQALEVLEHLDYTIPTITNEAYNRNLKLIAAYCNIPRITSHMARHTFAVWVINQGIPIELVAKMLGHSSTATTKTYAQLVQSSLDSAFDQLATKIH